jgi:hypothetical protein
MTPIKVPRHAVARRAIALLAAAVTVAGVVTVTAAPAQAARTKYWVDTWRRVPGSNCPGFAVPDRICGKQGDLYAGRNYVFCKAWGEDEWITDPSVHNHWWLLTDLDTLLPSATNPDYVSAYYLSGSANSANDSAFDIYGHPIPVC